MGKEYRSSANAFQDFIESYIWKDIVYELTTWLEDSRNILESPDKAPDLETVKMVQGRIRAIREMMQMPFVIMDNIKIDSERKE